MDARHKAIQYLQSTHPLFRASPLTGKAAVPTSGSTGSVWLAALCEHSFSCTCGLHGSVLLSFVITEFLCIIADLVDCFKFFSQSSEEIPDTGKQRKKGLLWLMVGGCGSSWSGRSGPQSARRWVMLQPWSRIGDWRMSLLGSPHVFLPSLHT